MKSIRILALLAVMAPGALMAGRYPTTGTQTFTFADDTTSFGDGTALASNKIEFVGIRNNRLRLTRSGTSDTNSSFKIPNLDPGSSLQSWTTTLNVVMSSQGNPADGWALNVGPIPAGNGDGEGGYVMSGGLVIAFDTYNNGGDPRSIEVFANGISVGNFPQNFSFDQTARALTINWDSSGLDLTYNGSAICTDLATPGYVPAAGHSFAFTARTGGSSQTTSIDDLVITTVARAPLVTEGPVISEFCADNSGSLEDENTDSSDWIEIYNGQSTPANMSGWKLTDDLAVPGKWTFPAVTIPAYGYLTVYASSKDRVNLAYPLHTNFSLSKDSGYLALAAPGGSVASSFNYGVQAEDVSYGLLATGPSSYTYGYLETASPGADNSGLQAAGPPAEDVEFLKDGSPVSGGLFYSSFTLSIQAPLAAGSTVRYTLDNTPPTASSPVYSSPFAIASTTTVRARVFTPGHLPGPVSSRSFLQMDSTLTNYHSSGQPFSSNLPIIVMDSFGVPVDSYNSETQPRPFRLTYSVVIDKDPFASDRAEITGLADFQGRSGTHVRGETSAGFPQRSYTWELWDNDGEDKKESVLGFPAESDWVLYAPYNDKTLIRNYLIYDHMRALAGNSRGMGVKFVELFYNQDGGALTEGDYRGVYVLVEKIKRDPDRVAVEKLNSQMTDPAVINGGYIFKHDKSDPGDVTFSTATNGVGYTFVEPENPNAAQKTWLTNHVNAFESALAGSNFADPASGYAAYINPTSFIDNQWFVEIAKQIDGYRISTYFYKDRNGKINCGPIWDYNLSLFNADYNGGDSHSGWYYSQLGSADYFYWPRLQQDPNYMIRHWDRYWELRRSMFATDTILNYIDGLASELVNGSSTPVTNSMANQSPLLESPAMRHYRKWPVLGTYLWPNPANYGGRTKFWNGPGLNPVTYTSSDSEVDAMKSFLKLRLAWIDDQNYVGSTIYRPPVFSQSGGHVSAGTQLAISNYTGTPPAGFTYAAGGTIYYTLDGSDPRGANGSPVGTAYAGVLSLAHSGTVSARLFAGGNWSPITTASFAVDVAPASPANLVISEICYKPITPVPGSPEYLAGYTSGNSFEYVELLNVSNADVDLAGCYFGGGISFVFDTVSAPKLILAPGQRVVLAGDEGAFAMRYGSTAAAKVIGVFGGNLSNSGETVALFDPNDSVIASVSYGIAAPWPVEAFDSGFSLVLNNAIPDATYTEADFRPSAQAGGTPGAAAGPAFTGTPLADSDGDGTVDLIEYATGSSANDGASVFRPTVGVITVGSGPTATRHLSLSFRRSIAADGVACNVQASGNLGTWSSAADAVTWVSNTNNGDGTMTCTWRATAPIGAARQFMRLSVVTTP